MKIKFVTINIHKGYSLFNQRYILNELREALHSLHADIVFLQEVHGREEIQEESTSQWEFLADTIWPEFAYRKNAVVENTHHGNAILSKFPLLNIQHHPLPSHSREQRGYLEASVEIENACSLRLVNIHLGLLGLHRRKQIEFIHRNSLETQSPMILAGDFNDWAHGTHGFLTQRGWCEAHLDRHGHLAATFPSILPCLRLDRVYLKSARPLEARVLKGNPWSRLSDHLPLWVEIEIL